MAYHSTNRTNSNKACACWENKFKNNIIEINSFEEIIEKKYDNLCQLKNTIINFFVEKNNVKSITEIGCGDGNRSLNGNYKIYYGYDQNKFAIDMANMTFSQDENKKFIILTNETIFKETDLSISLDILTDKIDIDEHINHLIESSDKYIIIYTSKDIFFDDIFKKFNLKVLRTIKKDVIFDNETICAVFHIISKF